MTRKAPKRVRQPLSRHEDGAHLYAPYWGHVKAGLASLVPFVILYFVVQPLDEAMGSLGAGGYTVAPVLIVVYACGWAAGSVALLHLLRFSQSRLRHFLTWALAGAVALTALLAGILTLVRLGVEGTADVWNVSSFGTVMLTAPLLGAAGAALGRWALAPSIQWHRWLEREPLPDALVFVEGKHDKDDFERM
ncbi:hypothetical protein [Demequina sp. NBRC 110056]|uniref:hypothetical protein n=1 Tax=Demequina sp. NBRC 110056 TaxID=1570345 RepID=UPI000A05357D|nr:hypothetical protein [Demequina sp. NBRC 110056]